jgi:hypothetical protein
VTVAPHRQQSFREDTTPSSSVNDITAPPRRGRRAARPGAPLLSRWLVALCFRGHRTGRRYVLPIVYAESGGSLLVGTDARWRLNFARRHPVSVWWRGRRQDGTGELVGDEAELTLCWSALLAARPVVGRLSGVRRSRSRRCPRMSLAGTCSSRSPG